MEGFLLAITAALTTIVCIRLMIPVAVRIGFVDVAKGHKNHEGEIPPIGGLAMYASLAAVHILWSNTANDGFFPPEFMAAAGLLVLIGAVDDRFALPINLRFVVQVLSILILALSQGTVLLTLGPLISTSALDLHMLALPVTVLFAVAAINAMNFMDGMDGLAGGLAGVSLLLMSIMAMLAGRAQESATCLAILGCVAGFMAFNLRCCGRPCARIFMGDAGSMLLGLIIASSLITLSQGAEPAIMPAAALWLFAIPLLNAVGVIAVRLATGKSPFNADRRHIHHLCLDAGYTVNQALLLLVSLHAVLATAAVAAVLVEVPPNVMFYGFCILTLAYIAISTNPKRLTSALRYVRQLFFRDTRNEDIVVKRRSTRVARLPTYSWQRMLAHGKHSSANRTETLSLTSCSRETAE